jgi:hypothetical protein
MKKVGTMIIAIGLVFLLAAPALALDAGNLKFSGEYRARGFSHSAVNLLEDDATDAYYDMRLRVKTTYNITDNVSLTTRFDALDRTWGTDDEDVSDAENIDFDAAYMTIKTPVGGLIVGRYPTTKFGTGLADSADNKDRIIYVLPIENWTFVALMQKSSEFDKGTDVSDTDNHKYSIVTQYKGKNFTAGALLGIYDYKTLPSLQQLDEYAMGVAGYAAPIDLATTELMAYVPEAFIKGKFGNFGFEAEIDYATGSSENATDGSEDLDASLLMYLAEASYDAGPFAFRGGYVFISGDEDSYDDEVNCFAYFERSADLDKAFILTGGDEDARVGAGLEDSLGGVIGTVAAGEVTPFTNASVRAGIKMLYAGVTYSPMENLSLDFLYANAKADEPATTTLVPNAMLSPYLPAGGVTAMDRSAVGLGSIDDDMGSEYDFTLTWKCLDNLEYKFVAAYLDAGDFYKQGDSSVDLESTYTLYNSLTLTF